MVQIVCAQNEQITLNSSVFIKTMRKKSSYAARNAMSFNCLTYMPLFAPTDYIVVQDSRTTITITSTADVFRFGDEVVRNRKLVSHVTVET